METETRFSFSSVASGFDEHITKSIRGYADLRDDVVGISRYFVLEDTNVIDIGCSQGTMLKRIKDENIQALNTNYTGIEINNDFQKHWKPETNLTYKGEDIRESDALSNMSFAISLFTRRQGK